MQWTVIKDQMFVHFKRKMRAAYNEFLLKVFRYFQNKKISDAETDQVDLFRMQEMRRKRKALYMMSYEKLPRTRTTTGCKCLQADSKR